MKYLNEFFDNQKKYHPHRWFKKSCFLGFSVVLLCSCGERFTNEGNALRYAMHQELARIGINEREEQNPAYKRLTWGHGNQVNFSIEDPDRIILSKISRYFVSHGNEVTEGVPISLFVETKNRKKLTKKLSKHDQLYIKLEIDQ